MPSSSAIVLDASAVGAWLLPDEDSDYVDSVMAWLPTLTIYAPPHWKLEVLSILRIAEVRKRITADLMPTLINHLTALQKIIVLPSDDMVLLSLSRRTGLTVYDAAYLDLGVRFQCPVITLDKALSSAAKKEKLPKWV